jgi:hypothetical protein
MLLRSRQLLFLKHATLHFFFDEPTAFLFVVLGVWVLHG